MKPIIIVMLCVQLLILLAAVWTVLKKATTSGGRPIWSSLAVSLVVCSLASLEIGDKHPGPAAELLDFGGGVLLGGYIFGDSPQTFKCATTV